MNRIKRFVFNVAVGYAAYKIGEIVGIFECANSVGEDYATENQVLCAACENFNDTWTAFKNDVKEALN